MDDKQLDQLYLKIAQLEKENEQFEIIFKNTSDNIALVSFDAKAEYLYVSPSIKLVLGYEPRELLGRSFFEFIHPDDVGKIQANLEKFLRLKSEENFQGFPPTIRETIEFRFRNKQGKWRHMDCVINIAGNKLIAVSRDISEERAIAKDTAIREELYSSLLENVGAGIGFYNLEGKLIYYNKIGAANMGGEPEDFEGKTVYEMFGEKHGKVYHARITATSDANSIREYEDEVELPDGKKWFDSKYTPIHNYTGEIIGVQIISFNISKLKNAEFKLKANFKKYQLITNTSIDGFLITTAEGKIQEVNESYLRMTGFSRDELLGISLENFESKKISSSFQLNSKTIIDNGYGRYEQQQIHKDGAILKFEVNASYLQESNTFLLFYKDITEAKKKEKQLLEVHDRLQKIIDNMPALVYVKDLEGKFILCNKMFHDFFKMRKEDIIGKTSHDLLPTDIADEHRANDLKVFKKGSLGSFEEISETEGIVNTYLTNKFPLKDLKGESYAVCGISVDISENKRNLLALQSSEEKYRLLVETAGDSIFLTSDDGKIIEVNNAACNTLGYSREDLLKLHVKDVDANLPIGGFSKSWDNTPYDEQVVFETIHRRSDGSMFPVELSSDKYKLNGKTYIFGIARDITERKQIENELQASEIRFRTLHNASFGGIAIHDEGLILDCNHGMETITGYKLDELIDMDGLLLIAPESRDMVRSKIKARYEKPYQALGIRKNGEIYPLRLEARMIPYKDKIVRVVEFRDITQRKQTEDELKKYRDNLEDLVKERTAELEVKNAELERFNSLFVGREFRIKELRDKLKKYEKSLL